MDILQAILLALIQGITEFLPISSSAHLILPEEVLGWPVQGLAFTVAVHVGSLVAVILYFRKEVGNIATGGLRSLGGQWSEDGKLAWLLVLGTIPVGLAGLLFDDYIEAHLQTSQVIAYATLAGALLLFVAVRYGRGKREIADLTWKLVLIIGIAQATALFPGTSRSGITITAALLLGMNPISAAKFSFLLSIPVIALTGGWLAIQLTGDVDTDWLSIGIATLVSGISAYFCIHYFLVLIQRIGFMPFILYRLALGILLLSFF
ncbi:MAG: undecaprenyl-diphosphate phosphatase [Porticoccaceae bacterium]|jgi:undecaprenyl-diphosphatase|nr:undecaprenyl-diphosphate phosphatase [Porticoccaceae bacterium]